MNNINIGHNNPPKKTRDDLIKQRNELTKSLINNMKPKYHGLGKRITPQQYSDSKESGFYVVCNSKEKVSFWLIVYNYFNSLIYTLNIFNNFFDRHLFIHSYHNY